MDPFEAGIAGVQGLHGVRTRALAEKGARTVDGEQYHFFYNPMWQHFTDTDTKAPGSYYYLSSRPVAYFWHLFDQVLIRPDLLQYFQNQQVRIIDHDGEQSLLTDRGLPDDTIASDHLPLLFQLDI